MVLRFDGTAADLIGTLSPTAASRRSRRRGAPADVDFYGPGTSHKRKVWGVSGTLFRTPHPAPDRDLTEEPVVVGR